MGKPSRRRRKQRTPCNLVVKVDSASSRRQPAVGTDISEDGIHLAEFPAFELDTKVHLLIHFPSRSRPLKVWGRVVYLIPDGPQRGVGIEFQFQSAEQRDRIAEQVVLLRAMRAR